MIPVTQKVAMDLVNAVIGGDQATLRRLTDPNIVLTSTENGGTPKTYEGQEAYLEVAARISTVMTGYFKGGFEYGKFTDAEGSLTFTQVYAVKQGSGDVNMVSSGTQTFTFANGLVTSITVTENTAPFEGNLADLTVRIDGQKEKIDDSNGWSLIDLGSRFLNALKTS